MATQLLPPVISSPFGERFHSHPYTFRGSGPLHASNASASAPSVNAVLFQRPRQASPVSILSVASAPVPANDENVAPIRHFGNASQSNFRSVSSGQAPRQLLNGEVQRNGSNRPVTSTGELSHSKTVIQKQQGTKRTLSPTSNEDTSKLRDALKGIEKYKSTRTEILTPATSQPALETEGKAQDKGRLNKVTANCSDESTLPDTMTTPTTSRLMSSDDTNYTPLTPSEQTPLDHRQRLSTNSSRFVHTVKTASFSHGSFSVMSKSLHFGRSSETRALFSSHSRFSSDSERPPTNYSVDESAFCRSVKRRQILDEIVGSEETYIADLKALVYLMSTLLASATSISSRLRHSMQQNVIDLLHLHERIFENLHRAAFKAAARKWADTISPKGPASPRHTRWRTLEPTVAGRLARVHRRTRSSIDSHDLSRTRARLNGAEPADVTDIISIYKASVSKFFAYEEYCANHEIIAHDLQRHLPTLWSTYEAGIESLARSLVSLERQDEDSRKALTVGDLLIKPIQRICKYPLLFEDLLKHTPVSDCPSTHAELTSLLQDLRGIVEAVNHATHSYDARLHIHRRWALQARLNLRETTLAAENLRMLGNVLLCGVLHVTYQTRNRVDGAYAMCILYPRVLVVAFPAGQTGRFDVTALIKLTDMKLESASDGKG